MPARQRDDPPSGWAAADHAGDDVYYSTDPDVPRHPMVWHWCVTSGRWHCAGTLDHTVTSTAGQPVSLSPSLLWPCCGKHGWLKEGRWVPA